MLCPGIIDEIFTSVDAKALTEASGANCDTNGRATEAAPAAPKAAVVINKKFLLVTFFESDNFTISG